MERVAHLDDELLSAYLDGELSPQRSESVEAHLASCGGCRARLDGLRRVVLSLSRLERASPPPLLAQRVERRVALFDREAGFVERLESRLQGLRLDSPLVVTFAVVLALATIVFLFSHGVANRRGDVSLKLATPEAAHGLLDELEGVEIEDRWLQRDGGQWVQEGTAERAAETVAWESERGRARAPRPPVARRPAHPERRRRGALRQRRRRGAAAQPHRRERAGDGGPAEPELEEP